MNELDGLFQDLASEEDFKLTVGATYFPSGRTVFCVKLDLLDGGISLGAVAESVNEATASVLNRALSGTHGMSDDDETEDKLKTLSSAIKEVGLDNLVSLLETLKKLKGE